jgi:hypothetical protein
MGNHFLSCLRDGFLIRFPLSAQRFLTIFLEFTSQSGLPSPDHWAIPPFCLRAVVPCLPHR